MGGADKEYSGTYGVKASGNSLELGFITQGPYSKNIGSRTYLMENDYAYKLFQLKNMEFTYTVDDSNLGTGKYGSCCPEIDIWEANSISTAFTMHACATEGQQRCDGTDCGDNGSDRFKGLCDKNGCDMQSFRLGNKKFFGPGSV